MFLQFLTLESYLPNSTSSVRNVNNSRTSQSVLLKRTDEVGREGGKEGGMGKRGREGGRE